MEPHPLLLFDGVCGLCNRLVDFLLQADHKGHLRFATLQGETGAALLLKLGLPLPLPNDSPETVLLWVESRLYERSDAVLYALCAIGGPWTLVRLFFIIPRPLRDAVYRWISRNRYQWFGKSETCRIPTPSERSRFLN